MVEVYSKPGCVQCLATKRRLDQAGKVLGVDYVLYDVSVDTEAYNRAVALNAQQMPLVVTPNGHWTGYSPDKLDTYAI